ncbi:uridine kinase URK1 [Ascoidea rubescens DSM 1968]|uniref:Uridine kinase n=1 Tax=Ascoidea rubescens DSM 1968 TaxID=1344418 RepID=A0A1D2VCW9_9ASCO|nr:uridine kinase [Ascoidea rubescens DSM 1968]ODV59471.1 uridine kinase [Ascoidea rubescens DSM 1968]
MHNLSDNLSHVKIYGKEKRDIGLEKFKYLPPWNEPYIIGIAGFSGSGKTSIAQKIIKELNTPWTILISLDNFYKPLSKEQSEEAFKNEYDFDKPDALDLDLCYECILSLKEGKKSEIPIYSFEKHSRLENKKILVYGANVIIIEGLYALYNEKLLSIMNLKVYVDTDLDICLARRLNRDILYRGRDLKGAIKQWNKFVKPNSERYIKPTISNANIVIPMGSDNSDNKYNFNSIKMMIEHIDRQLGLKSREHLKHLRNLGIKFDNNSSSNVNEKKKRLIKLDKNNQNLCIHSILINKKTSRDEFIFYFDRIANLLINKAMELIELELSSEVVCIKILRSGDCFLNSLKKNIPDIKIGELLIQSDSKTGEPKLHFENISKIQKTFEEKDGIKKKRKYFLMDAQIISGAGIIMAIQVLIDHGIELEDIIVVTYLSSEIGIRRIFNAFPQVYLVVGKMGSIAKEFEESEGSEAEGKEEEAVKFGEENDNSWWFKTRFVDTFYFGT